MKKVNFLFMALAIAALIFTGCRRDGVIIMRIADVWSSGHPMARAVSEVFKVYVEEKTEGAIFVDVFHYGQLGNEQSIWDMVRNGSLEAVVVGSVMNSEYRPMLISDWPFLYRDLEHAKNVWTGSFVDDFSADFSAFFPQVVLLCVGPNNARTFTSNKPLTTVADFKGQRFRMPANPIHTGITYDLGASAQVIPLNELFTALQTGVVDGQDNGMVTVLSEKLNEVQRYLYETNHIIATMNLVANAGFLNKLSEEHLQIVRDAADAAAEFAWNEYIKSVDTDRETLRSYGVIVTIPTQEEKDQIITAIQPTLNRLYAENAWANEITEKVRGIQ